MSEDGSFESIVEQLKRQGIDSFTEVRAMALCAAAYWKELKAQGLPDHDATDLTKEWIYWSFNQGEEA